MHAVTNIQKYSIHDGDGIRTTVFFKGCHLRCWWCHNPETQRFEPELQVDTQKCTGCGRCAAVCPQGAITISPEGKAVTDTLSGGEVMAMDTEYIQGVVKALHREGVDVTIDTCGQAPWSSYEAIMPYVHTWLYDVKVMDEEKHKKYIGMSNKVILDNLKGLAKGGARLYIRIPTVKEVNGDHESMQAIIDFLKENDVRPPQVNLLPYHSTGSHKYGKLGREYLAEEMTTPTDEEMQSFVKQWNDAGFANVKIGG